MSGIDWPYELGSLVPSIGVGLLFWFVMRALLRADRSEREADRAAEQEYLAAHGAPDGTPASAPSQAQSGTAEESAADSQKNLSNRE